MIVAQILFITAAMLHMMPEWDVRDVQNEEDVINHHEVASSSSYRLQTEIAAGCIWVSFPLILIALYAMQGIAREVSRGTKGEILVYVMEKSFLIWILIIYVVLPAITLVRVSYDWGFQDSTGTANGDGLPTTTQNGGLLPTGYYIQLSMTVLEMELIDAACVADASFFVSLFVALRLMLYGSSHNNKKCIQMLHGTESIYS